MCISLLYTVVLKMIFEQQKPNILPELITFAYTFFYYSFGIRKKRVVLIIYANFRFTIKFLSNSITRGQIWFARRVQSLKTNKRNLCIRSVEFFSSGNWTENLRLIELQIQKYYCNLHLSIQISSSNRIESTRKYKIHLPHKISRSNFSTIFWSSRAKQWRFWRRRPRAASSPPPPPPSTPPPWISSANLRSAPSPPSAPGSSVP